MIRCQIQEMIPSFRANWISYHAARYLLFTIDFSPIRFEQEQKEQDATQFKYSSINRL